jgi:hypothetical protein
LPITSVVVLVLLILLPLLALSLVFARLSRMLLRRWGRVRGRNWIEKRWVFWPALGLVGLTAGCAAYGMAVEADAIEVTHTEIRASRPVLGRERFRVIHLSDLHLEGMGSREREALQLVRRENPDLILLTGDYLNRREAAPDLVAFLRELKAPFGVFGVGGNWDRKFAVRDCFAEAGARYLEDDWAKITAGREELLLLGLDIRPGRTVRELLEGASPRAFRILLQHYPESSDLLAGIPEGEGVDLFLCGHTHGGQVRLPLYGALFPRARRWERGLYREHGTLMYVNRGLGMEGGGVPRIRFLARPEIAVIDLVR